MGHVPLPPPLPYDAALWPAGYVRQLEKELNRRRSKFGWRRRQAHYACRRLILHRERVCGLVAAPQLVPLPKPPRPPRNPSNRGLTAP